MNSAPIFLHSLFRSGSTYLFKVFRRSPAGYCCYQEPLHEAVLDASEDPEKLLRDRGDALVKKLRHPALDANYFQELFEVWPAWKDTLTDKAVYEGYFASPNEDIGLPFLKTLLRVAKGRPVLQECRTAGRIAAFKEAIGGVHIYLWRNPWDQWWSYKVDDYFDQVNQIIINASYVPAPVVALRTELGFYHALSTDIASQFSYFASNPLAAEESFLIFYLLWCLALHEGRKHAHLMLNIDQLSDSPTYRENIRVRLEGAGITNVDFSDCHIPQSLYFEQDRAFFVPLEDRVHGWLRTGGWTQEDIDHVKALRRQFEPACWNESTGAQSSLELAEQTTRARELARRMESKVSAISREVAKRIGEVSALEEQHKARGLHLEEQALTALRRAEQAEAQVLQAESRAQQAEERVLSEVRRFEQAETRAQQAESRAQQAEERVLSEVRRFERTEARAQQAEARAQQDAIRAELAEHSASELASVLDAVRRELDAVQKDSHDRWQLLEAARKELKYVGELNLRHLQLAEASQQQIQTLWNSTSWRVTTPLRWLGALIRNMPVNAKLSHIRKDPVGHLIRYVVLRPKLKSLGKSILKPFPTLEARLRARRAIQIRSSFEFYDSNPGGEVAVALSELQRSGVGASTQLLNESKLQTVDEILERIRRELVQTRLEQ